MPDTSLNVEKRTRATFHRLLIRPKRFMGILSHSEEVNHLSSDGAVRTSDYDWWSFSAEGKLLRKPHEVRLRSSVFESFESRRYLEVSRWSAITRQSFPLRIVPEILKWRPPVRASLIKREKKITGERPSTEFIPHHPTSGSLHNSSKTTHLDLCGQTSPTALTRSNFAESWESGWVHPESAAIEIVTSL